MVCELEYMNMGPANYRVCYATDVLQFLSLFTFFVTDQYNAVGEYLV